MNDEAVVAAIRERQRLTLRTVRESRKLSQRQLATAIGVSNAAVSQWEAGTSAPTAPNQMKIAKALGVPWSTLFGLDGEVA